MATLRVTAPGPEAGALVPDLPADLRAALADIGGDQFAAAMAARVWPLAVSLFADYQQQESCAQRRVWAERAIDLFQDAHLSLQRNRSEAKRQRALQYVAGLPDEMRLMIAPHRNAIDAPALAWLESITAALDHPALTLPARKGPLAEAGEVCRASLPVFHAAGVQPTARAVRLLGNAAAESAGLRPLTLRHWQQALKAARPT